MFGPYRLDGLLGHGPSATVYRAVDSSHGNRVVALKVSPQLSADAGFRERSRRDASVLGALREPRIVPIHRYGELVIHDLTTGERLGAPLTGHEAAVTTLGVTHPARHADPGVGRPRQRQQGVGPRRAGGELTGCWWPRGPRRVGAGHAAVSRHLARRS
jgi:hypothetical protein